MASIVLKNKGLLPSSYGNISNFFTETEQRTKELTPSLNTGQNVGGMGTPRTIPYSVYTTPRGNYSALPQNTFASGMEQGGRNMYSALPSGGQATTTSPNAFAMGMEQGAKNQYAKPAFKAQTSAKAQTSTPNSRGQNLLNFVTSNQGQALARGLLEASGYSTTPVSFGQALAQGMAYMNEADKAEALQKQQDFENKLLERQMVLQEQEASKPEGRFTQATIDVPDGKGGFTKQLVNIAPDGKISSIGGGGTNINIGDETSKGFEKVNEEYAKEFQKWNVSGGYANQLENLKKIDDVIDILRKAKDGGANVTGAIGAVPKFIRSFTNPTSVAVEDDIKSIIFQSLRETLGAQFTEREGERLVQASFNILLDEETNIKRLQRMKDTILESAQAKENAAIYFRENNGDMSGYTAQTAFSESASDDFKLQTTFNGVFAVDDYKNLSDQQLIQLYSTADPYEQQFIEENAKEIGIKL